MPNVYASAGAASRAQNELSMLFVQARKMCSAESSLPATTAREKDTEYGRSLTNKLSTDDADSRKLKSTLALLKVGISIVKLIGAGFSAGASKSKEGNLTDTKAVNEMSKAGQAAKSIGTVLGTAIAVGQQVIAAVNALADMKKANKNLKTLDAESGKIDSATAGLDTRGKA